MPDTINLDVPHDAAERVARQDADRECQCPACGRLHRHLRAGKPPPSPEIERLRAALKTVKIHLTGELIWDAVVMTQGKVYVDNFPTLGQMIDEALASEQSARPMGDWPPGENPDQERS